MFSPNIFILNHLNIFAFSDSNYFYVQNLFVDSYKIFIIIIFYFVENRCIDFFSQELENTFTYVIPFGPIQSILLHLLNNGKQQV